MTIDAERSLIGALLLDPQAVKVCGTLRPDMFLDRLLGRMYQEFLRAYDLGYAANLVTLSEHLSDIPQGDPPGSTRRPLFGHTKPGQQLVS